MPAVKMHSKPLPVACFAPPLTDETLARYRELVGQYAGPVEVKDALASLLACVSAWWELPESKPGDAPKLAIKHRGKDITVPVVPLEEQHVKALDPVTPWMRELDTLSNREATGLFDGLTGPLRDAAFSLLWHAKELTLGREPITQDKLAAASEGK